jgi:hypothetical protein
MSATKYLKVFTAYNGYLAGAVYEFNGKYIAVEKSSSMGFETIESAEKWLLAVCKGEPMELTTSSMIPVEIRKEIANVMSQINNRLQEVPSNLNKTVYR